MRCLLRQIRRKNHHLMLVCKKSFDSRPLSPSLSQFIPSSEVVKEDELVKFQQFLESHKKLTILTGAGISTESGIPDYRSEGVGLYATSSNRPVQYADFLKKSSIRQRYWARNYTGWLKFSSHLPNRTHYILSDWERKGRVHWLITQNVDALHFKAGSHKVTELHGSAHRVMCLSCPIKLGRMALQEMIREANPDWNANTLSIGPDGDVELDPNKIQKFEVPACPSCGGILKPDITFFGDNVPKRTVHTALEKMFQSDALLVVGSSLEVYSGYRFVNRASDHGMRVAIINIGPTRGDKLAEIKISGNCGDVLQRMEV